MNMKINSRAKERIARTFGEYFTTNDITNVFKDFGVQTDESLYAKWRITLDAFSRLSDPDKDIPAVIEDFCHPLNFEGEKVQRETFIETLNDILSYDDLKLVPTEKNVKMVSVEATQSDHFVTSDATKGNKTSTDYVLDAVNFFKNEYNKVRIKGLTYDFSIGENASSEQTDQDPDEYSSKLNAIKRLHEAGLITEYHIEERVESNGYYVWDYAICKLNEAKLTGEEEKAPPVSADAVSDLKEQVIRHEHSHKHSFENSIQEKPIDLQFVADEAENESPESAVKLSEHSIVFDDETATLKVGSLQPIRFPSHKKEHFILRHMFGCRINEAIDWELVYETISGHPQDKINKADIEKLKRSIRDGISAINNRISETLNTESKLLTMQDNAVIRHF